MRFHSLGSAGPLVSALGMGCIGMTGGFYGDADEDQAIATLNRALLTYPWVIFGLGGWVGGRRG